MTSLSVSVRTRVEPELRERLEREAERQERPPAYLMRRYLREGLERDHAKRSAASRA